ncbi:hypothetical protein SeLEV6574_g03192 [Synchytrium endobioticum]|uniref:Spindle assembly abnormal protein 6 N-terminal domain-containing protein n=1 Tax=Synchytrium endobioticum TaxID=286115 RepID=A0A507D5A2_9FUNG|nr:hypothetical protein SeLEV6574_g03192 [Synchytrium endobioticum]
MMGESPAESLFSDRVPVTIKPAAPIIQSSASPGLLPSSSSPPHRLPVIDSHFQEKKHAGITIQLALSSKHSSRLKVLEIQLTDESDPFFLYQLDIGEDDFHALKSEQNLLVDFAHFPVKFIELLEECIACRNDDHPKFLAQLITDSSSRHAIFNVVETNTFKAITHLSLHFIPGNDAAVKTYLANLVREYKGETASLRSQLSNTTNTLTSRLREQESMLTSLNAELDKLKISSTHSSSQLQILHAEELAKEKERALREREAERRHLEKERRDCEVKYEEQLKSLSQKHTALTTTHSHLLSHTQTLEERLSNASRQTEQLTRDLAAAKQESDRATAMNRLLEKTKADLEREINHQRDELKGAEKREREREDGVRRQDEALQAVGEQKGKLEDALEMYKAQNARLEEGLRKASDEINKGNEIIRRLQSELKAAKSKVKLKNVVTLQQEKLLDERAATIDQQSKDVTAMKESLQKKTEEAESLQARVEELTKKVDEGRHIIEDNNHVIEWLHKQLNEDALSRPLGVTGGFGAIDFEKYTSDYPKQRTSPTSYRPRYTAEPESRTSPPSGGVPLKYAPYQSNSNPNRLNSRSPPRSSHIPAGANIGVNTNTATGLVGSNIPDSGGGNTNTVNAVAGTSGRWQPGIKTGLRDEIMHNAIGTNGAIGGGGMAHATNAREEALGGTNRVAGGIKSNYF